MKRKFQVKKKSHIRHWGNGYLNVRRWNKTAEDCYILGCNCSKCPIYEIYFKDKPQKCFMKYAVWEMVRKFGIPDNLKKTKKENVK